MFSWITDHIEAALTFFGAILLNAVVLAMGYGRLSRRIEDLERGQDAFLMPAEAVWSNVGRHRSSIGWSELFALKKLFGASVQAITCRCADLGIFPQSLAQSCSGNFLIWDIAPLRGTSQTNCPKRNQGVSNASAIGHSLRAHSLNLIRPNC